MYLTEDEIAQRFMESPEQTAAADTPLQKTQEDSKLTPDLERDRREHAAPELLPLSGMIAIMHATRELCERTLVKPPVTTRRHPGQSARGEPGSALPLVRFV
jgi:hypothetical protein